MSVCLTLCNHNTWYHLRGITGRNSTQFDIDIEASSTADRTTTNDEPTMYCIDRYLVMPSVPYRCLGWDYTSLMEDTYSDGIDDLHSVSMLQMKLIRHVQCTPCTLLPLVFKAHMLMFKDWHNLEQYCIRILCIYRTNKKRIAGKYSKVIS